MCSKVVNITKIPKRKVNLEDCLGSSPNYKMGNEVLIEIIVIETKHYLSGG